MTTYCKVTGETPCQCSDLSPNKSPVGSALIVDLRSALRRLFGDHTWYTSTLISASVPILQADANVIRNRLLRNPQDIYDFIAPIVGEEKALKMRDLFTEHLVVVNSLLEPIRTHQPTIAQTVQTLYVKGDLLAEALYQLNPKRIHYSDTIKSIRDCDRNVVQLAILRNELQFEEYIDLLDTYTKAMLSIADTVYVGLI